MSFSGATRPTCHRFGTRSIARFDYSVFANLHAPEKVAYTGKGEILDVLAAPRTGCIRPQIDSTEWLVAELEIKSPIPLGGT